MLFTPFTMQPRRGIIRMCQRCLADILHCQVGHKIREKKKMGRGEGRHVQGGSRTAWKV